MNQTKGPRLFTLSEAEAQLPFVQERVARFQKLYTAYETVRDEISVLRLVACSGGDSKNPDSGSLSRMEAEQGRLLQRLQAVQDEMIAAGCVPKSFQEGLIDFFALKDNRLVFLCWKQGEERIQFWHTLEGGFAARRPIETFSHRDTEDETEA